MPARPPARQVGTLIIEERVHRPKHVYTEVHVYTAETIISEHVWRFSRDDRPMIGQTTVRDTWRAICKY